MPETTQGWYLLDRDEVERIYGIPKRYLESSRAKSEGPKWCRIGRLVRYRRCDVEEWIERQIALNGDADVGRGDDR